MSRLMSNNYNIIRISNRVKIGELHLLVLILDVCLHKVQVLSTKFDLVPKSLPLRVILFKRQLLIFRKESSRYIA